MLRDPCLWESINWLPLAFDHSSASPEPMQATHHWTETFQSHAEPLNHSNSSNGGTLRHWPQADPVA